MAPVSDPDYAAQRQKRYRERLKAREATAAAEDASLTALCRAVICEGRSVFGSGERDAARRLCRRLYPEDELALDLVTRGASAPATTFTSGWANELTQPLFADLLATLGPMSAAAELLSRCLLLDFASHNAITIPGLPIATSNLVQWIGEGKPIPVQQFAFSQGTSLAPHHLKILCGFTREQIEGSNAEQIVRQLLTESAALTLDATLFGSAAGTADQPAGLLNGISPIVATSGGGTPALIADLTALIAAIAPVTKQIIFVADPATALKLTLLAGLTFTAPVLASSVVPAKRVIAVGTSALVAAFSSTPRIETSRDGEIHFHTAPADIGTAGTPAAVVAAPTKSLFQVDAVSMRLVQQASWGLRAPQGVAYTENVTW